MANDFSADSTCIALYRYEDGTGAADSKGSETLSFSALPPITQSLHIEGAQSELFQAALSSYGYRTDANLGSTFPLKSGTSNKTFSVATWVQWVTYPADGTNQLLWGKTSFSGSVRTFGVMAWNSGGNQFFFTDIGKTDGTYSESWSHGYTTLTTGVWYHLTVGYRDSDKAYRVFLRDSAGNTLGSDLSGTAITNIALFSSTDFMLGTVGSNASPGGSYFDGYLDETVVFNRLLTAAEATNISKGLYSGTGVTDHPITATSGVYTTRGVDATFRIGSPTWLRYRK